MQATPFLITGTPADAYSLPNTSDSPYLHGILVNFDSLTAFTTFSTFTSGEVSISSPDGLEVLPFSSQSAPNEMFDNSAAGSANISIGLTQGTTAVGVGIADSDAVTITLQALNSAGAVFGPAFNVTIPETVANPGNGYYVIEDSTADIFGLKITQPLSNANYSGLAIDDVQVAPEPSTLILLIAGAAIFGAWRLRKRAMHPFLSTSLSATFLLSLIANPSAARAQSSTPTTPIRHVVIIFGENISFDHYFGTYPNAVNPPGQPRFKALSGTPAVNGLTPTLLTANPNLNAANGTGATNPFRLNRTQALTPSQGHSYTPEQNSFDLGAMDLFPLRTGSAGTSSNMSVLTPAIVTTKGIVMGYYDGNTVTGLWNYAQNFAMSDNSYNSNFGPSTPGALNLISGQTNGITSTLNGPSSNEVADGHGGFTLIGDADPLGDTCSSGFQVAMGGTNVGDLLNTAGLTWGWFHGGFDLGVVNPNGSTGCQRSTVSPVTGLREGDYVQHHQPFQYYASTRNPTHARPTNVANIGFTDAANHQYDTHDFFDAMAAGNLPAVSFLKAQSYQDAHPGNSNPLDEQAFVVNVVNTLEQSQFWSSTAVIVAYDDSDGWYDHQQGSIVNGSFSTSDTLSGTNRCGTQGTTPQLPGPNSAGLPVNGRCAPGVRTPLLVISPWAQANFVDHTFTIQTSVLRFIEDNWNLPRIGSGSFDAIANPINAMFNFASPNGPPPNTNAPILSTVTGLPQ